VVQIFGYELTSTESIKSDEDYVLMRTTVEIDEKLLHEAIAATGTKKKRKLIELALQEVIRQRRLERLLQRLGKTPLALTADELQRMRADD